MAQTSPDEGRPTNANHKERTVERKSELSEFDSLYRSADWRIRLPDRFEVDGAALTRKDPEQRVSERIFRKDRALMRTEQSGHGCLGIVSRNISENGFGFLSPVPLVPNDRAVIVLRDAEFTVVVVHCKQLGVDCYEVGSTFLTPEKSGT